MKTSRYVRSTSASLADVRANRMRVARPRGLGELALVASGDRDTRPCGRQHVRDGETDAARSARDQCRCALEVHPAGSVTFVLWLATHCHRPSRITNTSMNFKVMVS